MLWPNKDAVRLRELWANGLNMSEIGAQLGKSRSAIAGQIRRLGLTRNPAGPRPKPASWPRTQKTQKGRELEEMLHQAVLADKYYARTKRLVEACTVNSQYDQPWIANRSMDGSVVYRDRHIPRILKCGVDTDRSLATHELA